MNRHLPFRLFCSAMAATLACFVSEQPVSAQSKLIELEIHADQVDVVEQQRWSEMLSRVGANRVRIRSIRGASKVKISEETFGKTTSIKVVGILTRGGLALPSGKFKLRDQAKIKDFIGKLRDDGAEVTLAEKKAFGLTAEQLVAVHQELSAKVEEKTRGREVREVMTEIVSPLKINLVFDDSVRRQFAEAEPVGDELQGLSAGTALAALARPLGLVIAPRREQGKETELLLTVSGAVEEHWPVGWPLQSARARVAPKMFERMKRVEINDYILGDALTALQKKARIPFLLDHNSMARHGADLSTTRVTLVKDKQTVASVIQQLLNQSRPRLTMEYRADETGKAFLWISTVRR